VNSLTIAADLSEVDNVRQFLKESLQGPDISEEDLFKIELALVEMCVNVIRYGYPDGGGEISIEIREGRKRVIIEIWDSGIPFDPRDIPKPDLEEIIAAGQKGGLGIYLARELMDEFDYRHKDKKNILTMVKKI
jgi:serine/threonine-protein kinase RsbW